MAILQWFKNHRYTATRSFQISCYLGVDEEKPEAKIFKVHKISKGETLYFDGTIARYGEEKFNYPNLAKAIQDGWLTPWYKYQKDSPKYGRPAKAPIVLTPAIKGKIFDDPEEERRKFDQVINQALPSDQTKDVLKKGETSEPKS